MARWGKGSSPLFLDFDFLSKFEIASRESALLSCHVVPVAPTFLLDSAQSRSKKSVFFSLPHRRRKLDVVSINI